jgi:hypothetical protein
LGLGLKFNPPNQTPRPKSGLFPVIIFQEATWLSYDGVQRMHSNTDG